MKKPRRLTGQACRLGKCTGYEAVDRGRVEEAQAEILGLHDDSTTLFDTVTLKDLAPHVQTCP